MGGERNQWAVLAGLRFVLAVVVVLSHLRAAGILGHDWLHGLGPFAAVAGFFLISGYSIAASVQKDRAGFLSRRVRRIFPLALLANILTLLLAALLSPVINGQEMPNLWGFLGNLLMLQGFLVPLNAFDAPLWSLSLEWWYYALAPALLRCRRRTILGIALAGSLLYVLHSLTGRASLNVERWGIGWACMAPFWLLGFALSRWPDSRPVRALVVAVPLTLLGVDPQTGGGPGANATLLLAVSALLYGGGVTLTARARAALNWLGDLSYPLYVLHWPVFLAFAFFAPRLPAWAVSTPALPILAALALAVVALYAIDYPVRCSARRSQSGPLTPNTIVRAPETTGTPGSGTRTTAGRR